ncbi:hypothetical protein RSAG8_11273, partial [Rhizoctonia solani AG-8 WAC10335]
MATLDTITHANNSYVFAVRGKVTEYADSFLSGINHPQ